MNRVLAGYYRTLEAAMRANRREIAFFCIVGGIGFVVDLGLFIGAQQLVNDVVARCIALAGATTLVWWLNRRHTFLSEDPRWGRELARFTMTRILGTAINFAISLAILWTWPQLGRVFAIAAGTGVALVVNYLTSKHWAYKT